MRTRGVVGVAGVAALALMGRASGQVFNLTADYSETANPNWHWTFVANGAPLQKLTPGVANSLNPAVLNGFWGVSALEHFNRSVMKVTGDGPIAGLTLDDFLAGDVVAHGANPGTGVLEIRWGGSARGSVTVGGRVWYAHSSVNRVGRIELKHNTSVLATAAVGASNNRSSPVVFASGTVVNLAAGDQIRLAILPEAGQTFACLMGIEMVVQFTAHPCPADLTFAAIPGQPGYLVKNGVVNNEDFFAFLGEFSAGNLAVADLTTTAIPGTAGYGVPDGVLNNEDFFYYLGLFAAGC